MTDTTAATIPMTRTIEIEWTELTRHRVRVNVPLGFEPDRIDMANELADIDTDGFLGLERENISVEAYNEFTSHAETFDPM